ncbi:hypothetical protein DAMA08_050380 [Martiniozyma asiatica (nom. inval.)]|nr:hypothetical protein DAMA08_050380 [Martiniozyma asiatica]
MSAIPGLPENFDPENPDNLQDIEKQFAVKAVQQMEVYWNLVSAIPGTKLKLTQIDDEILEEFYNDFPEYKDVNAIKVINEEALKSKQGKERWRNYIKKFEDKVQDFNFGTLIRTDSSKEYDQDNTVFVVRLQFYAFEIARNRAGLNDWACRK